MTAAEFLDLLLRWVHLIAGIMWIGNSMLFNWLDRNLVKPAAPDPDGPHVDGKIWLLHSGAFYEVEKKLLAPNQLPDQLHWFKWQNGFTWLSGIGLLVVVYYGSGGAFLIDPAVRAMSLPGAIALSVAAIVGSWLLYDLTWRTLGKRPAVAAAVSLVGLAGLTYALAQVYSGRAAYIHVGVILGTVMTGNVWQVILPSQRELIAATKAGRPQDRSLSLRAKERSIHNNYMTFPLLFTMLSNHFPSTYGHPLNWLLLGVVMVAGAGIRHFMNVRFHLAPRRWIVPSVALAAAAAFLLFALTARRDEGATGAALASTAPAGDRVSFAEVREILTDRCVSCHSAKPTEAMFPVAPANVMLDTPEQMKTWAARIKDRVVVSKTMPFINKTGMPDAERVVVGRWVDQGAPLD